MGRYITKFCDKCKKEVDWTGRGEKLTPVQIGGYVRPYGSYEICDDCLKNFNTCFWGNEYGLFDAS